jgi:hypothetical protein
LQLRRVDVTHGRLVHPAEVHARGGRGQDGVDGARRAAVVRGAADAEAQAEADAEAEAEAAVGGAAVGSRLPRGAGQGRQGQ